MSDVDLREEIVGLLTGRFANVPMESVYRVVGRVSAGVQNKAVSAVQFASDGDSAALGEALKQAAFVASSRGVEPGLVVAALTDAVQRADLGRRASGSFSTVGAFDAPPMRNAESPHSRDVREPLVTADLEVVRGGPATSAPSSTWVPENNAPHTAPVRVAASEDIDGSVDGIDDVDGQFRASWDPLTASFEIEPLDMAALLAIADQLMVERGLIVQFSPAPRVGTQIHGRLRLPSARGVVRFAGQVAFVQRRRVTFAFDSLGPADRRAIGQYG